MSDDPTNGAPETEEPPYVIEGARSARSKCKICRKKIDKDVLRLGTLIEGPFGTGYIWEHLKCAAKRSFDKVEEAYAAEAWNHAKEVPEVPDLTELAGLKEEAEKKREERKALPHVEVAPSGRSRCKHAHPRHARARATRDQRDPGHRSRGGRRAPDRLRGHPQRRRSRRRCRRGSARS